MENYLTKVLCHGKKTDFLPNNQMPDQSIEINIRNFKSFELSTLDKGFNKMLHILASNYANVIEAYEDENDFFEPLLQITPDGEISVTIHMKKKEID